MLVLGIESSCDETGVALVESSGEGVPVLRADGTEILCSFLIERSSAEVGRAVYVAWIDRVEG